ncbi:aldehyde dehydrogenase family protein [Asanoa sp. WMMD1127]|uniref:aldehyde dehydrogenase family protein n=1 Tax=Asanoa sp. WMMD1127 TaxID=3016107 RepID=UPI002415ED80|nr:aldehyde dehydrogenase family protein [Asanoa sp. WMMD1127]MDG4825442.1 aldehyde dehydrogenase family protein [Asanoa sp. WMMD1127]
MIVRDRLYVGGAWVPPSSPALLEIRSPHDGSVLGQAVQAAPSDVDDAVAAARAAFDEGPWRHTTKVRALSVARRLCTGTVTVNGSPMSFDGPFGGYKASGIGREYGMVGLLGYIEHKSVTRARVAARSSAA